MENPNEALLAEALGGKGGELQLTSPQGLTPEEQLVYNELLKQIEEWRVRRTDVYDSGRYLLEYGGIRCFPRGDILAVSGREKCGKTTSCRMIAAAVLAGGYQGIRSLETGLRVLWIDTEQYKADAQNVLHSLEYMCGRELTDDEFVLISLRGREIMGDTARMAFSLTLMFNEFQPDLVIIDGIRDYISDFNDVVQSTSIVLHCMALANGVSEQEAQQSGLHPRKPSCVLCNLHLNKPKDDNNMMGHLGSALAKKAGEIYTCAKNPDTRIFSITQTASRGRPWEQDIEYTITNTHLSGDIEVGIPQMITSQPVQQEPPRQVVPSWLVTVQNARMGTEGKKYYRSADEFLQYNNLADAFHLMIGPGSKVRSGNLSDSFMSTFQLRYEAYDVLLRGALDQRILYRLENGERCVFYCRYEDAEPYRTDAEASLFEP